jgi:probable rRNA maturation factor
MIRVNVVIDHPRWKKKIKNPEKYLKKKIKKLSKIFAFKKKNQEFSILLTNSNKIKKLNNKFRKKNKTTDVLSFPNNNNFYIGDIAISFEAINKKSNVQNFNHEFDKIWIHGYLHLVGYEHKKNKDYNKMNRREKLILNYMSN